jgi:hypothetical protein
MITGFEEETKELSEYELSLVPIFIRGFLAHTSKRKAIQSSVMETALRNSGYKVNSVRIRAIVHHIRKNEKIYNSGKLYALLSDNNGYWLSNDKEEIEACIKSLQQRAGSIQSIAEAIDVTLTSMNYKRIQREEQELQDAELLKNQGTLEL